MRSVETASWQRQRNMFPNLRLMLGASFATVFLIAVVGAGLFAFRDPSLRIEVPQISRPMLQPILDDPRQSFGLSLTARRNGELQRLLALPSTPVHAYAPEPGTGFPYELGPRDSALADELEDGAPAPPAAAVVAAPVADQTTAAVPAEATAPASDVAALAEASPPVAESIPAAIAAPAQPTAADIVPPVPANAPVATAALEEPSITAAVMATLPPSEGELAALAEAEDMPLPRRKPTLVPAAMPDKSAGRTRLRHVKVTAPRSRRLAARIHRLLPPPTPPAQAYPFPFFDLGYTGQYDAEGRPIDTSGILAAAPARAQTELGRTAGNGLRPVR